MILGNAWTSRIAPVLVLLAGVLVAGAAVTPAWGNELTTVSSDLPDGAAGRLSVDYLISWGKYALAADRYNEAEARFRDVLNLDWNHPTAYRLLQETWSRRRQGIKNWRQHAQAAMAEGNWPDAELFYSRILGEEPDDADAAHGLNRARRRLAVHRHIQDGLAKFITGDYPGAQLDFEQALALDPSDTLAMSYRERAEESIGHSSSLADLRSDKQAWGRYLKALKKFRAGDLPGAENLWRSLLDQYPGNEAVESNLEQIVRRRKNEYSAHDIAP